MYARHQAALAELTQALLAHVDLSPLMRQALTLVADMLAVAYSAMQVGLMAALQSRLNTVDRSFRIWDT